MPLGEQRPLVHLSPARVDESDAADAIALGAAYGLKPDPWQETVLRDWLARRRDSKWAASKCGLAVPRQNGKNAVIEVRELFGMVVLGEKWLHTAHEVKTARKAFLRLASFFENERKYPELAELVAEVRKTNGQEAIVLTNGGSVEFVARSKGSGRGFTVDGIVLDEAQELVDEALEALLPTTSAGPLRNAQHIYTGTPPGPKVNGEVFKRLRAAGHDGKDKRLSWIEWGMALSLADLDLDDRALWARANPGLGFRLGIPEIEGERTQFSDEGFARERGGMWDEEGSLREISAAAWAAVADPSVDVRLVRAPVLALDVAPNHASASIVAAGVADFPILELVETRRGASWLPARAAELREQYGAVVALNSAGPIGSLIPALEELGVEFVDVRGADYTKACGLLAATVNGRALRHHNEPEFTTAILGLKARRNGDGFSWTRAGSSVDITPIVAASVALWAASLERPPLNEHELLSTFH